MAMNTFEKNATVILVHGAWADGSSWSSVINPLRDAGLGVICAPIPLTSLSDDIAVVTRMVERAQGPVLLAGHAYGGAPMAGVTHERIKGLVYIAALAPDTGETVAEVFYREKPHPQAPALAPDARGYIWMPESGFANAFAQHALQETLITECNSTANLGKMYPGESSDSGVEIQANLVSGGRGGPDDPAHHTTFYGRADEGKCFGTHG
jgi:pimeloyl-ACP methyl ester carboxylesterase